MFEYIKKYARNKSKQLYILISALILLFIFVIGFLLLSEYQSSSKKPKTTIVYNEEEERIFNSALDIVYTNPDSAKIIARSRIEEMEGDYRETYKMLYYNILGISYFMQYQHNDALHYYYKMLEIALEKNLPIHTANAYNNIAAVNILHSKYKEALDFLIKAYDLYESINDHKNVSSSRNNIGRIYLEINDLEKAYQYLSLAFEGFSEHENEIGISSVASHLAQYYFRKGEVDSANKYFNKAVYLAEKNKNNFGLSNYYLEKGNFLLETGQLEDAINDFYKSDSIIKSLEATIQRCYPNIGLARAYLQKGDTSKSLAYVNKAADIAYKIDNDKLNYEVNSVYADIFEAKGDINKAYDYHKLAMSQKDKLNEKTELSQVYNLEIDQLSRKMATKELELEREKLLLSKRKNNLLTTVILLVLSIIVLSFLYYIYINRIKQRQKDKLHENKMKHTLEKTMAVMNAEINERKRIGAELHDGVGTLLSITRLNLSNITIKQSMTEEKKSVLLHSAIKNIDEVIKEMKNISIDMAPLDVLGKDFKEALKDIVKRVSQLKKHKINLSINGLNGNLLPFVENALYRTVQEVMNNIVKHADCCEISIQVLQDKDELSIMIEDDGVGFDTSSAALNNGLGLRNAKSRIESLNGVFLIDSMLGRGTIINISLPVKSI